MGRRLQEYGRALRRIQPGLHPLQPEGQRKTVQDCEPGQDGVSCFDVVVIVLKTKVRIWRALLLLFCCCCYCYCFENKNTIQWRIRSAARSEQEVAPSGPQVSPLRAASASPDATRQAHSPTYPGRLLIFDCKYFFMNNACKVRH